jgi:small subunit ribosomal protein S21
MVKVPGNTVIVQDGQFEKAMRKFKKKVQTSGILMELREREHYVKPTTRRKLKAGAARSRWRKHLRSQQLPDKPY